MRLYHLLAIIGLLSIGSAAAAASPAPRYSVTDLGTLGGAESVAYALNNKGQVIGAADTSIRGRNLEFMTSVFLWEKGKARQIKALPGNHYFAAGINDAGQIAGAYSPQPQSGAFVPIVYAHGKVRRLGALPHRGESPGISQAYALNNSVQIVGVSHGQAFVWKNGKIHALSMPRGIATATAYAVNAQGQSAGGGVGQSAGAFRTHALLWRGGKVTDIGTLPGFQNAEAHGINARGQVVGWSGRATGGGKHAQFRAFLWQNGKMRGLGSLPHMIDARATGINDRGDIIGRVLGLTTRYADQRAVLWRGGKVYDLTALLPKGSGWVLQDAVAINNQGWIIGNGLHRHKPHAYLLKPLPAPRRQ